MKKTQAAAGGVRLRLRDGRGLGYAEYGDPHGAPVLYFHGFPGSRLEAVLAATSAQRLGVRLIAPDRPGYGLSDFKPGRTLSDWPEDVRQLADMLGLERFAVLGVSGGGPYALACARKMLPRLAAVAVVGSFGPGAWRRLAAGMPLWLRSGLVLSWHLPAFRRLFLSGLAWGMRHFPERLFAWLTVRVCPADAHLLAQQDIRARLLASLREGLRPGAAGAAHELRLYRRPWGFDLREVTMEVHLWHGECDTIVPAAVGRKLAAQLPRCRARFCPQEGHYSLPVRHMDEILGTLRGAE